MIESPSDLALGLLLGVPLAIVANLLTDQIKVAPRKWRLRKASKSLGKLQDNLAQAKEAHRDRAILHTELTVTILRVIMVASAGVMFAFVFSLIGIREVEFLGTLLAAVSAYIALNFATQALQLAGNVKNFDEYEKAALIEIENLKRISKK